MFISLPVVVLPVSSDCLSFAGIAVDFPTAVFIMKIMKMRMVVKLLVSHRRDSFILLWENTESHIHMLFAIREVRIRKEGSQHRRQIFS